MPISFAKIAKEATYSRQALAELWGYASSHTIARGVVTPRDDNKIVLFVTEEKQSSAEQYADRLIGGKLEWEGRPITSPKIECSMQHQAAMKFISFIASGITRTSFIAVVLSLRVI